MIPLLLRVLLLIHPLNIFTWANFPPSFSCELNSTQAHHSDHRIIFYHTRKCGGWTIHNYFAQILKTQYGNTCQREKGQIVDKTDWRCEMGYLQDTPPPQQCLALKKFYDSR
jgi:hypothetical protein